MMTTQTFITEVVLLVCGGCGTHFGLDNQTYARARQSSAVYFRCTNPECPSPSRHYTETDLDLARRDAASAREAAERERNRAEREADRANRQRRRAIALKGVVTRTKRRIAHGVCPCCRRTFANVARHMTAKHPSYKESAL